MTTFLLVHGAWHSGAAWDRVVPLLESAGHRVLAPSLTGYGDKKHLLSPETGLDTHVQDIVDLLRDEEDVVLVGHSYAGLVITGVADRAPERVAHLVYLDAANPHDGEAGTDLIHPEGRERLLAAARRGEPAPLPTEESLRAWGLRDPDEIAGVLARLRPLATGALTRPVRFRAEVLAALPRTYVYCTERAMRPPRSPDRARTEPGWRYRELRTGHLPMLTAPSEVAALLLELAA